MRKSFNVFGVTVPVKFHKGPIVHGDKNLAGYYDLEQRMIHIAGEMSKELTLKTLYHELAHAMQDRLGLRQCVTPEVLEVEAEGFANFVFENFNLKK
jgi:Zn-dependent peptidase ImmA (M78 family)